MLGHARSHDQVTSMHPEEHCLGDRLPQSAGPGLSGGVCVHTCALCACVCICVCVQCG